MKWKIWFILCTFPLLSHELEERVNLLENQMKEVLEKRSVQNSNSQPTIDRFEKGGLSLSLTGGPIYWNVKMGGNEYVYELARKYLKLDPEKKESLEDQNFDWNWGYRLGAFLGLNFMNWELGGNYTHFWTQDTESYPHDFFIQSRTADPVAEDTFDFSHDVTYDSLDLELRRSSFLSRFWGMGSSLGVKAVWVDQSQKVARQLSEVKDRCYFHGVGPRFGGHFQWNLLGGISVSGNVSASILYGDYIVKCSEENATEMRRRSSPFEGKTQLFAAHLGFFLGLGWDYYAKHSHFGLTVGYEGEYMWRQNRVIEMHSTSRLQIVRYPDDLTFYGLVGRLNFEF